MAGSSGIVGKGDNYKIGRSWVPVVSDANYSNSSEIPSFSKLLTHHSIWKMMVAHQQQGFILAYRLNTQSKMSG